MADNKQEVAICSVTINCPGMPAYHSNKILPAASSEELKQLIMNELKALFQANSLEAEESAFQIRVLENNRKVVDPMFKLVRFCTHCDMSAVDAGVPNDSFVHCGKCGKPTTFQLKDPEPE